METIFDVHALGTFGIVLCLVGISLLVFVNIPYEELMKDGITDRFRKKLIQQKIGIIVLFAGLIMIFIAHLYVGKWMDLRFKR